MSYTLRGRLESRLAASVFPLAAGCALALAVQAWWPLQLAALMLGVGLLLDGALYHRLLPYQPGWAALPLGLGELGVLMALVFALGIKAPLEPALALFAAAWLVMQLLVHAAFPLLHLSYGDDGGELGKGGPVGAAVVLALLAGAGGVAWATQPPTVRLAAGVHEGPLVLSHAQELVGEPGAVVRGGIVVTADDVVVRDVTVLAGENGIEVDGAEGVVLERVRVSGATLDAIQVRRGSVTIRDCLVHSPADEYAQGIDISFSIDLAPSLVEGCEIVGGYEGIVTHSALVDIRNNRVRDTTLRGIAITEMSMGSAERNDVRNSLGVGIYCGDYSHCSIERNAVSGTRPDHASSNGTRMGYAILAVFGAEATLRDNELTKNHRRTRAFANARIHPVD